ncbi:TPA: DUF4124 domain-containing protein [Pseudomonas aeruginosa]|nr:DUF4124 domain-containing protein [Pseudomonas aeruginosa]HBP6290905.1 DUF4124 domain-containing protein [Pseudomonas aeruginosa]
MKRIFPVLALLLAVSSVHAATVFKCVGPDGKVTFTQQNCPENQSLDDVVSATNQRPSGSGASAVMAKPKQPSGRTYRGSHQVGSGVIVVGGSSPSPTCSTGLSERDLRKAKVQGKVVPGMSREDVESIYGKVNRNGSTAGAGAVTYWNDKYVDQTTVSFDRNGCVQGSYQSGHKN